MTPRCLLRTLLARNQKRAFDEARTRSLWRQFGRSVRAERKEKKIRLVSFAARMGISRAMCSYLESGTRQWSLEKARKAVEVLTRPFFWPDAPCKPVPPRRRKKN